MSGDSGFPVIERSYSDDPEGLSVGLANISAVVPDIDANKDKILRAARVFKEKRVNLAVFPEFCLSGYFWEDEDACWPYMRERRDREAHGLARERAPAPARRRVHRRSCSTT